MSGVTHCFLRFDLTVGRDKIVIGWDAWLALTGGKAGDVGPVRLEIRPLRWSELPFAGWMLPDPINRPSLQIAIPLAAAGLLLAALSFAISLLALWIAL